VGNVLRQIWLVVLLGLVFGMALAFTDQATAKRIAANRQRQIRELAQRATLGELNYTSDGRPDFKIELKYLDDLRSQGLWAYKVLPVGAPEAQTVGYAIIAEGIGWDRLKVLIGLSPDVQRITGLEILECRETPGLGERIKTAKFRTQYKKCTDNPLELVKHAAKNEYQDQAITGATRSSEAVTNMVNAACRKARKLIIRND